MKRHLFTLIEIMISLVLFTLLLSSLFFWYRRLSVDKAHLYQRQTLYAEEQLAHGYLQEIFSHVQTPIASVGKQGVAFIFKRGVYDKPQLAGEVLGHLYFDKKTETLSLGTWPHPKKGQDPSETHLLLTNVTNVVWRFFSPPNPKALEVQPDEIGKPRPTPGWKKHWDPAYPTPPALIKVQLTRYKDREVTYCFELPVPLIYKKEIAS